MRRSPTCSASSARRLRCGIEVSSVTDVGRRRRVGSPHGCWMARNRVPCSGGSRDRTGSSPIVSAKREYPRTRSETFGDFHSKIGQLGVRRRGPIRETLAFTAVLRAGCEVSRTAGMPGWGGRDRTSEWRNQNPLPYRLATPQQAEPERARAMPHAYRFGQRPVYRGCQAISTGWNAEFRPKSPPGGVTHYNRAAYAKIPARFRCPRARPPPAPPEC